MLWVISGPKAGKPCIFPFKLYDVTAYGCLALTHYDEYNNEYISSKNIIFYKAQ